MDAIRVLVVDDETQFVATVVKRLARRDIDASGADCGRAALAALALRPCDVVILDVKMPGMDGLETLREIKRLYPDVEVVMLTGHATAESGGLGMSLGAFDYLMKPADLDDLVEKIRQAHERCEINRGKRPEA
ncbi:MAG: response regulator [Desulfovibrionaceae bacterium]|nr:response regulator [Desulfovibrionaceae bacterium]MBF0513872.1 response regulator [Desulfovibrionaceae bacterium]